MILLCSHQDIAVFLPRYCCVLTMILLCSRQDIAENYSLGVKQQSLTQQINRKYFDVSDQFAIDCKIYKNNFLYMHRFKNNILLNNKTSNGGRFWSPLEVGGNPVNALQIPFHMLP
jgi:hypothetical protein